MIREISGQPFENGGEYVISVRPTARRVIGFNLLFGKALG